MRFFKVFIYVSLSLFTIMMTISCSKKKNRLAKFKVDNVCIDSSENKLTLIGSLIDTGTGIKDFGFILYPKHTPGNKDFIRFGMPKRLGIIDTTLLILKIPIENNQLIVKSFVETIEAQKYWESPNFGFNFSGSWISGRDFIGGERMDAVGFVIGKNLYVGLGRGNGDAEESFENKRDFWVYDTQTTTWDAVESFPASHRSRAVSFSLDTDGDNIPDKGYVGGGGILYEDTFFKDFWEFDPSRTESKWKRKADLEEPLFGAVGFSIQGKGYIGTGMLPNRTYTKKFWEYDCKRDTFTPLPDFLGEERVHAACFVLDTDSNGVVDKAYVGSGQIGKTQFAKDFWEFDYNKVDNPWKPVDTLMACRFSATGFSIEQYGYICLGRGKNQKAQKGMYKFIAPNEKNKLGHWMELTEFPSDAMYNSVGLSVAKKGYIITGQLNDGDPSEQLWEYYGGECINYYKYCD